MGADSRLALDEINRAKASSEKSNRALQTQLNEILKKVEEAKYAVNDIENAKRKISAENADFLRCVGELDNKLNILLKIKNDLMSQQNEAKAIADNEARERQLLMGKYRNIEHEVDGAKEVLDEETSALDNICRTLSKAEGEAQLWHRKYEVDAVAKAEELEMGKMKLQARLSESEMTVTNLQLKLSQVEKVKAKHEAEHGEMMLNLDQAQILQHTMEKRAKQFDKTVCEWKSKVDSLARDLDVSQKDCRIASAELFKIKSAYDESVLQLDEVRRENKTLSNEIKDIMDQISEGGRSIHEIHKITKRLESEKMELQAALEEAEGTLEQEENKVLRAQLELSQMKQDIERKIAQKEEFLMIRKYQTKAIESMQAALEVKTKSKTEAMRMKKKLETDVLDLEAGLEHANASNAETQKTIQKHALQVRDVQAKLDEESHAKSAAHDALVAAERRFNANRNSLEESRTMLEQSDRNRRAVEQELSDANEQLSEAVVCNQAVTAAKRKMEQEMTTLNADLDEMSSEAQMAEDRAQKAMIDAARLADELRIEQETAMMYERDRKLLEAQVKDIVARCDDADKCTQGRQKKLLQKWKQEFANLNLKW